MKIFQRIAGWFGWSGSWPDQPERLVVVPGLRDPSPDLLRRLRLLDARAEVVYVGAGRWWVGRVKPDAPRRHQGRRLALRAMDSDGFSGDRWAERRQGLLMAQGFGLVVDLTVFGEPDGRLVQEFTKALHYERTGMKGETEEERIVREILRDAKREQATRERDLTKWAFSRLGRGNAWLGSGSNTSTGRRI